MKLIFNKTETEKINWKPVELWQEIEENLQYHNLLLNNLRIDGEEVMDNFLEYLQLHQDRIQQVEVITITLDQYAEWLMKTEAEVLTQIGQEVRILSDGFYGALETDDWSRLTDLIEQLSARLENIDILLQISHQIVSINQNQAELLDGYSQKMQEDIKLFQKPFIEQDAIYLADLLHFELEEDIKVLVRFYEGITGFKNRK